MKPARLCYTTVCERNVKWKNTITQLLESREREREPFIVCISFIFSLCWLADCAFS